jgi:hypothetical protein
VEVLDHRPLETWANKIFWEVFNFLGEAIGFREGAEEKRK